MENDPRITVEAKNAAWAEGYQAGKVFNEMERRNDPATLDVGSYLLGFFSCGLVVLGFIWAGTYFGNEATPEPVMQSIPKPTIECLMPGGTIEQVTLSRCLTVHEIEDAKEIIFQNFQRRYGNDSAPATDLP